METALTFLIYTVAGAVILWATIVIVALIALFLLHE